MSNSHVDAAFRAILAGICPPPHPCRHHPLVESVAPIALRLCAECLENAHRAYANYDAARETYHGRENSEEVMRQARGRIG